MPSPPGSPTPGRVHCGRYRTRGYTDGERAAATPPRWSPRRRVGLRCTACGPGGGPVHALLSEGVAAILDVDERWGTVARSHRKLAHRGSYEQLVWVSPATFRRVLIARGLTLPTPVPRSRSEKRPWPDWLVWVPNRIWIWDATHFTGCRRGCFANVDIGSRKWID